MNFKKEKIVDERVANLRNEIYKEAFFVAITVCMVSILIKFYLYGVNAALVLTEFAIIIIAMFYTSVRTISAGIYSDEIEIHDRNSKIPMNAKNVLIGMATGIALALFFGIRSSILYGSDANRLWYFFLVFISAFIIYVPVLTVFIFAFNTIAQKLSAKANQKDQDEI